MTRNFPKILVLGSLLPGSKDGGGVVKDEILKRYPKDRYVCFALDYENILPKSGEIPESLQGVPYLVRPLAFRLRMRGAKFYAPFLRAIELHLITPWRIREAINFGRKHKIELVWGELQGYALLLVQKVAKGLGVPFVGSIWDDPQGWFQDYGFDSLTRGFMRRKFRQGLAAARNISVSGEAMQRAYEKEYGIHSVILRHGFESPVLAAADNKREGEIAIGFVGSSYGRDAWIAFLSAIARLNKIGRVRIRLLVFGTGEFPYRQDGVQIEIKGWLPAQVMLRELASADFCYFPYWFAPAKRRHAEFSFPNKFETYLAAGKPVLFHGPEYAGITEIIHKYGVGLCVHSLKEEEIIRAVERLAQDAALRNSFSRAAIAAFHAEFNAKTMMRNFEKFING